jgi:hypothetical protein
MQASTPWGPPLKPPSVSPSAPPRTGPLLLQLQVLTDLEEGRLDRWRWQAFVGEEAALEELYQEAPDTPSKRSLAKVGTRGDGGTRPGPSVRAVRGAAWASCVPQEARVCVPVWAGWGWGWGGVGGIAEAPFAGGAQSVCHDTPKRSRLHTQPTHHATPHTRLPPCRW